MVPNMQPKKLANRALTVCLGAVALVLVLNIVWVDLSAAGTGTPADPDIQRLFYVLGGAALLSLAGAAVFWIATQARGHQEKPQSTGSEALVQIADRARDYLRGMYMLLWVIGAYLIGFGFVLIPFGDNLGNAYQNIAPSTFFSQWIALLLAGFWIATFVIWIAYLVRVRREWNRLNDPQWQSPIG